MQLSEAQQNAADAVCDFITDSDDQVFQLHGYAGTGKTTILKYVAERHPEARLCAFTGKAASVLAAKTGCVTSTVHSLFYRLIYEGRDEKTGKPFPVFAKVHVLGSLCGRVILLDECSMISIEMAIDLLESGARIVACGDPGQLPPVMGKQAFREADIMLTEVHRQAENSPILRQATSVRTTGRYRADTDCFRVVAGITDEMLLASDVALCFRNKTRHALNARIRALVGFKGCPKAGEMVVCKKNVKRLGLYNGCVYTLAKDIRPDDASVWLDMPELDEPLEVMRAVYVPPDLDLCDFPAATLTGFEFGYALTVHKSQGSEWERVCLFDECNRSDTRRAWVYTALTRASKSIIVASGF